VHNTLPRAFSIIIPAWNEAAHIEATVHSAYRAIEVQNHKGTVIVVDNNSSDDTASLAQSAGATVVFEPINQIARARNTGAKASNTDWLIFLDADTSLSPALLELTLTTLADDGVIGGGSTVTFDRELRGLAKATVAFWNWWSVKISVAAGCYIFCSKEAFDSVGGFDERQYAAEELYFSKRLRKLAKKSNQQFKILTEIPILTSARKFQWYSTRQKFIQVLQLLVPGSTRSKSKLAVWYDRSNINDKSS